MSSIALNFFGWLKSNPIKAGACLNAIGTIVTFFVLKRLDAINLLPFAVAAVFSLVGPFFSKPKGKLWQTFLLSFLGLLLQFGITAFIGLVWFFVTAINSDGFYSSLEPRGNKIVMEEQQSFFKKGFQKYGLELAPNDKVLHASYFTVADDMYSDVLIESEPELVESMLAGKVLLSPLQEATQAVKRKFDTGKYVLCDEKTDAKIVDEKLISLICDEKALVADMMIGVVNPESDPYLIVRYFPQEKVVWLHEVNW